MVHFLNRMLAGTGRPSVVLERSSSAAVTFALMGSLLVGMGALMAAVR
ncbi:hypothetical protein [Paraburkholderia fungorum]|uniref:Uncharacterized protein n=1 Tax=Paraburkholderia fungorum TaxID=134537 RepID=A0AAW3UR13_9BURK|nr:hypothetical protein [Paraburkholderia fungorum]MBB6200783.1 hypothetical protein [Paraburkholderia fungorum]